MKQRTLLLLAAFIVCTSFSLSAQTLLVDEEFSSSEWEAEFLRLNPGSTVCNKIILINTIIIFK